MCNPGTAGIEGWNGMDYQPYQPEKIIEVESIVTVHYFEFARGYVFDGEAHDFWEFVYMDKGEAEIGADGRRFVLSQGQGVFHQPGEFHSIWASSSNPPDIVVVSFVCHSSSMECLRSRLVSVGPQEKALIAQLICEARDGWCNELNQDYFQLIPNPAAAIGAQQWVLLSLEMLLLCFLRQESKTAEGSDRKRNRLRNERRWPQYNKMLFRDIEKWVHNHLNEKITTDHIAFRFNISHTSLKRLFREEADSGVNEQICQWRHKAAKRFIREGHASMEVIAENCGYTSIHYFSRRFSQMEGMTPTEYARSVKSKTEG